MDNPWLKKFLANAPPIDDVREDAARCCEETARYVRKERGPLRDPISHGILAEFPDAAFGVASEVAEAVAEAMVLTGAGFTADMPWTLAATLLRNGWQRGHRIQPIAEVARG